MKMRVYKSLFAEGGLFKLNLKLWKYLGILEIIMWIVLQNFFLTIIPFLLMYGIFRLFTLKDPKFIELLVNNSGDRNKYYNP